MKIEDLELGLVPGTEVDIVKEGNKYVLVINPIGEVKKKCDAVLTRDRGIYVKYFRVWPDMKAASISRYIKGLTRPLTSDPLLTHPPSSIFF